MDNEKIIENTINDEPVSVENTKAIGGGRSTVTRVQLVN